VVGRYVCGWGRSISSPQIPAVSAKGCARDWREYEICRLKVGKKKGPIPPTFLRVRIHICQGFVADRSFHPPTLLGGSDRANAATWGDLVVA